MMEEGGREAGCNKKENTRKMGWEQEKQKICFVTQTRKGGGK